MKKDNTETTESTNLNEAELENVKGGAFINLDSFITVLNADSLRNSVGMSRPKGLYQPTDIRELSLDVRTVRGL